MKTAIVIVIALVLVSTMALAQSGEEFTTLLGIHLGSGTSLDGVEAKLGTSKLVETGDAGDYKAAICYYVPKCRTNVEFSSGELGGSDHEVNGFTLTRGARQSGECSDLLIDDCTQLNVSKMHLGMSLKDYRKKLDKGVELEGGFYQKVFERREPMTESERSAIGSTIPPEDLYWDIIVFIRGAFRTDCLEKLQVTKTATY